MLLYFAYYVSVNSCRVRMTTSIIMLSAPTLKISLSVILAVGFLTSIREMFKLIIDRTEWTISLWKWCGPQFCGWRDSYATSSVEIAYSFSVSAYSSNAMTYLLGYYWDTGVACNFSITALWHIHECRRWVLAAVFFHRVILLSDNEYGRHSCEYTNLIIMYGKRVLFD